MLSVVIKTEVVSGRVSWLDMKSTPHLALVGMLNHHCKSKYITVARVKFIILGCARIPFK